VTTVSGPLGWLLRRAVMAPLMVVLVVVLAPVWLLALLVGLVRGAVLLATGNRPRWRLLRVVSMAWAYALGECLCVLGCLLLWLASGLGLWLRADWSVRAHRAVLRGFLGALLRLAGWLFGFRLEVREPERHPDDLLRARGNQPVLVLARHAGPGASFALVHLLLARYERHLHVVLKDTLRLDPAIDLLLSRTGCTWVSKGHGPTATEAIRAAAGELDGNEWTPVRHLAAVARVRRKGRLREAAEAIRMPHVLPPRPAGTVAALQGAPEADVLVFTHTGHDELLDASAAWQALPLRRSLTMTWWRAPAHSLDVHDEEAVTEWLHDTWRDIDAWVSEQNDLVDLQDGR
jgi:1-acyl-sn-glycerol-3-phosphate acyltransferase